jgi:hypothetical protein
MKNPMLDLTFAELDACLEKVELQLRSIRSSHLIQQDLHRARTAVLKALTDDQCRRWNRYSETLKSITKSKKVLALQAKWDELNAEEQMLSKLLNEKDDILYTIHQKRQLQRPALVHSAPLTGYEMLRARVAKSMGLTDSRNKQRVSNTQRLASKLKRV